MSRIGADYDAAKKVEAHIAMVRSAGLTEAADIFSNVYWGWIRLTEAYTYAHPYVGSPEPGMTPLSALSVTDFTFNHWSALIPGTAKLDDKAVLAEAAADEAWHHEEDRRMRRAYGEPI